MIHIIKTLLFILVNLFGYNVIPLMVWGFVTFGIFPQLAFSANADVFKFILLGVGTWVWIAAALASLGYFFVSSREVKTWLLLAPMYCPLLYGLGVLTYFNLKPLT